MSHAAGPSIAGQSAQPTASAARRSRPGHALAAPTSPQTNAHFAVGITNSAPLPIELDQRCITDFCFV